MRRGARWTVPGNDHLSRLTGHFERGTTVSVQPIRLFGDPVLRTPAAPVVEIITPPAAPAKVIKEVARPIPPEPVSPAPKEPGKLAGARPTRPLGAAATEPPEGATLEEKIAALERREIASALAATGGNKSHAAQRLGLSRQGLLNKMDRYGLK